MLKSLASRDTVVQTETRFFLNDQKNKHKIFLQPETLLQNKLIFNFLQNKTVV